MRRRLLLAAGGVAMAAPASAWFFQNDEDEEVAGREVITLEWQHLVPLHLQADMFDPTVTDHTMLMDTDIFNDEPPKSEAEVVREIRDSVTTEYNGKTIKLPGYAVPISLRGAETTEFLLVPYIGACIHVPPPPPNQIVFVRMNKPYEFTGLFDPIWVTGQMQTTAMRSELADIGYHIEADVIEEYIF